MAIYSNSLHYSRARFGVGVSSIGGNNPYFNKDSAYIQIHSSTQVNGTTSYPAGYRAGTAVMLPIVDGGISGRVTSTPETTSTIMGDGYMTGTITISITTTATGDLLANISGTTTITITTSGAVTATGYISGTCNIGADPSADDIAQAVAGLKIEGDYTMRDLLRIMSAVLAGKTNITGSTATFRNLQDTKDRVEATMTGSERTTITLDIS
jgi:hypothetical protein